MSRWHWILLHISRRLWLRAAFIGFLGVGSAMLAAAVEHFFSWEPPFDIGEEALGNILNIIATSMLAVTTFSLGVMVSAFTAATNTVTPRATKLLAEDLTTQNVLSTFIGTFLFAIVGIVVLEVGAYEARGRAILFTLTICVIALIVVSLLRWIHHLTHFGRVGDTTARVEHATRVSLEERLREPWLGGRPMHDPQNTIPAGALALRTPRVGYVQHVDMPALAECCAKHGVEVFLAVLPGTFVYADSALAYVHGASGDTEALLDALRETFTLDDQRGFDQDPRYGLAVLSEIALRALSPAMNDVGTAIDVVGRATRLLSLWAEGCDEADAAKPGYPAVHVPTLQDADLFEDAFMLIARDGAAQIEIQVRLQKSFRALSRIGDANFRDAARAQARMALERAESALEHEADKARVRALAEETLADN